MGSIITHSIQPQKHMVFFHSSGGRWGESTHMRVASMMENLENLRWTMVACKRRSKISCVLPNCRFNLQIVIRVEGNMMKYVFWVISRFGFDKISTRFKYEIENTYLASCRCQSLFFPWNSTIYWFNGFMCQYRHIL